MPLADHPHPSRASNVRRRLIAAVGTLALALWIKDEFFPSPPPEVELFDVGARARAIAAASPEGESLTDTYYVGPRGSVHLHLLGRGIVCNLHLHEHTNEASLPVMGPALVTQMFGLDGGIAETKRTVAEGTLIVSPTNCAHAWANSSRTAQQGNLVITFGDTFPGNLFVAPDDARIRGGGTPHTFDTERELEAFVQSADELRVSDVPITSGASGASGSIAAVLLKRTYVMAPSARAPTVVYAARGAGRVDGAGKAIALAPTTLVVLRAQRPLTIVADQALALFVVRFPD